MCKGVQNEDLQTHECEGIHKSCLPPVVRGGGSAWLAASESHFCNTTKISV